MREPATPGMQMSKTGAMSDGMALAARARIDFADMIEGLSDDQLRSPTLCSDWTPHHMAAHLVTFIDVPLPKFMLTMIKSRGNADAAFDTMAQELAERPIDDLVNSLRSNASKGAKMPGFPPALTVTDTVVHMQDVRRALGIEGAVDPELLRNVLEFLTTSKKSKLMLEKKGLLDGLRLEATDLDWSHGEGALVSGPAESLIMAAMRRPTLDELTGDGVETLRMRLG